MIREIKNKLQLNVKTKILVLGLILVVVIGVFVPIYNVSAQNVIDNLISTAIVVGPTILKEIAISKPFWWIAETISFLILRMTAAILQLSGGILDFVLNYTVVNMSAHIDGNGTNIQPLTGINIAWRIVRDLMNIAFIFLLVFEGIKMIVGQGSVEKIKKFIAMIVLASLLVNFSLFFTKVLIDASNIITIGIYKATIDSTTPQALVPGGVLGTGETGTVRGISAPFMKTLGLQSFYSASGLTGDKQAKVILFLMGSVFFLIVSFVFFAVACMFVIRYFMLILLLMLSPIAFMGMALPFMRKYANDWWSALNSQLLFAPVYMVLTLIILTLMASPGFITNGNFSDLLAGGGNSSFGLVLNFAVVIGLAIASLVIAKSTATKGSSMIGSATGKLTAFAGGAIMGGASMIGRGTVGRAGNWVAGSERLKNLSYKKDSAGNLERDAEGNLVAKTGISGALSRSFSKRALKTGDTIAKSTFDARSTGGFGTLAKATGVSFGSGAKAKDVNFRKDLEKKAQKEADYAKLLKPTDAAKDKLKEVNKELEEKEKIAKAETNRASEKLKELNEKKKKLEEYKKNVKLPEELQRINEEIVNIEQETKEKSAGVEKLKAVSVAAEKARQKGEEEINNLWEKRVNAYAETFENEKGMRWFKNLSKIGTGVASGALGVGGYVASGAGVLGGSTFVTTKADNNEIARKIRGVLNEKKKPKNMKELKENLEKAGFDLGNLPEDEEKEESNKKPEEKTEEPPKTT